MKYIVKYKRKKKKGYSNQLVVFLTPEGAYLWKDLVESQGAKDVNINVI